MHDLAQMMDSGIQAIPLLALYAETHFRFFRFFPSFLYRRQPEALFDMPARIAPGRDIPVMLMLNDIDKYPVDIEQVTIDIYQSGSVVRSLCSSDVGEYAITHPLQHQSHVYMFDFPADSLSPGRFLVNGRVRFRQGRRTYEVLNDNLPTSSKAMLQCRMAKQDLPGSNLCCYCDLHVHSQFSQSHVEFGPPVSVIDRMAYSYGLSCVAITDHSYDLCCSKDNYLEPDDTTQRWHMLRNTLENKEFHTVVILGEEVSVLNGRGKTVHLGALGTREFVPGKRDGGRRNFRKNNDLTIQNAVDLVAAQNGISYAAHPGSRPSRPHRLFLGRGKWKECDVCDNLLGFQAFNSNTTSCWYRARKLWTGLLSKGRRIPLLAGNDAHGDFNRYRSIKVPFVQIGEAFDRHLSYFRTGIYGAHLKESGILDGIRSGRSFVTNGPFLTLSRSSDPSDTMVSNTPLPEGISSISAVSTSSYEFGALSHLRIFRGRLDCGKEFLVRSIPFEKQGFSHVVELPLERENGPGYMRAELVCRRDDGAESLAATSPCYFV